MEREIELANYPGAGQLAIGVDPTLVTTLLAPALILLMKEMPGIRYTIINGHRPVLSELLEAREIDLYLSYPTIEEQAHDTESMEFSIPPPILVGRSGHPLSTRPQRRIHEYFEYPRLGARLPDWYLDWAAKELLREELDIDPSTGYLLYADDLGLMKAIVKRTDSLIGLYRDDVRLELEAGVLMELNPINWPEQVPVELITAAGRPLAVSTEKLVETIVATIPP
jgi:DNA-binding transcriptional LysR family regulator